MALCYKMRLKVPQNAKIILLVIEKNNFEIRHAFYYKMLVIANCDPCYKMEQLLRNSLVQLLM